MVMWYTWTLYSHGVFCSRNLHHAVLFGRTHDLKLLVRSTSYVTESLECHTFFSDIRHVVGNDAPIPHFTRVLQSISSHFFLCKHNLISGLWQMTFLLTFNSSGSKLDPWWEILYYIRWCDILSSNKNCLPLRIFPIRDHWSSQCRFSLDWASSVKRPPT